MFSGMWVCLDLMRAANSVENKDVRKLFGCLGSGGAGLCQWKNLSDKSRPTDGLLVCITARRLLICISIVLMLSCDESINDWL